MATAKSNQPTSAKETPVATKQVDTEDLNKMNPQDAIAMLEEQIRQQVLRGQKEADEAVTHALKTFKGLRKSWMDLMDAVYALGAEDEQKIWTSKFKTIRVATKTGKPAKTDYTDTDKNGGRPEVGKTYSVNGVTWMKKGKVGRVKSEFIDAIKGGALWSEMEKKEKQLAAV